MIYTMVIGREGGRGGGMNENIKQFLILNLFSKSYQTTDSPATEYRARHQRRFKASYSFL